MELSYWESRWKKGNTGFHSDEIYRGLLQYFPEKTLLRRETAFVPLCGKSEDLLWLAGKFNKVVGVDVSMIAIEEFIENHKLEVTKRSFSSFTIFDAENIELWCGDFLKMPVHKIRPVDFIYDKAAIVALPEQMRPAYAAKLKEFCNDDTIVMLQHFVYEQSEMSGPPFSVSEKEIKKLFGEKFTMHTCEKKHLPIENYQKFYKRGLKSHLIDYLLLLSRNNQNV